MAYGRRTESREGFCQVDVIGMDVNDVCYVIKVLVTFYNFGVDIFYFTLRYRHQKTPF